MKITGMSKLLRISVTASMPEPPSPRLMSARTRPGRSDVRLGDSLVAGRGGGHDLVAKLRHQIFQIERDNRLVLDDHDARGQLAIDGLLGVEDGGFDLVRGVVQDEGSFIQAEGLDGGQVAERRAWTQSATAAALLGVCHWRLRRRIFIEMAGGDSPRSREKDCKGRRGADACRPGSVRPLSNADRAART